MTGFHGRAKLTGWQCGVIISLCFYWKQILKYWTTNRGKEEGGGAIRLRKCHSGVGREGITMDETFIRPHIGPALLRSQRWNSWTAFLSRFLGINSSLLRTQGFVWFSTLIYKMIFMNRLKFSWFANFFVSTIFFKIRQNKGLWIAWIKILEFYVKMMSKNSTSGLHLWKSSVLTECVP